MANQLDQAGLAAALKVLFEDLSAKTAEDAADALALALDDNLDDGSSGAPATADYLVKTANGSLSAERVVTDTASVVWDWGTAGQVKADVQFGGWSTVYDGDFASADVSGATDFTVAGITWTFTNKAGATWGSGAGGITIAPSASSQSTAYTDMEAIFQAAGIGGYLPFDWQNMEVMVEMWHDAGDFTSGTPSSEFQVLQFGLSDTGTSNFMRVQKERTSTSPSGNGLSLLSPTTATKVAATLTTINAMSYHLHRVGFGIARASTTASPTMAQYTTAISGPRSYENLATANATSNFTKVRFGVARGSGASSAFTATVARIRISARRKQAA